jgi:WD40 repeat protein
VSTGHDGDVVLTGVGDTLVELDRYPMGGESGEARFAPRGSLVYAGGFEPPFALVELQVSDARLVPQRMHPEHRSGVGSIDHDPSGTWLVTGDHDHGVHLYDIGPFGSLGHRTSLPVDGRGVHTVRFSPDGSRLARTASRVDEVELLDLMPCVAE